MGEACIIGVDIGTTSTKAVLYKKNGQLMESHKVKYPLETPVVGAVEQDPEKIYNAVVEVIQSVVKKSKVASRDILTVSFSSAMHSVIAVDGEGQAITKSITWADSRSEKWIEKIKKDWNGHEIYLRTGTPIHPMTPLSKLIWMRYEHPDIFAKSTMFISIKEYIFYRFFGEYIVDYSIASGTGMFHLKNLTWDEEALRVAGVSTEQLSKPVSTTYQVEGLNEEIASQLGLLPSTPFVIGASDGMLSNLGVGAIEPGVIAATIGTSGAIRTVVDRPIVDPKGRIFCYALTEDHWVIGGASNNGGIALQWALDQFGQEEEQGKQNSSDAFDLFAETAAKATSGSRGLLFFPYLTGERAPLWNADARGSYVGLSIQHRREHIIRATFEGILLNLYSIVEVLEDITGETSVIYATGGFSRSPFWRQMMADIFDKDVFIPENYESSCLGAMVLGLYSFEEINSLSAVSTMIGNNHHHQPNKEEVAHYNELKRIYSRIAQNITKEYEELASLQKKWT
ncbi:gluconate kinase, FGGY family [Marininema mesophilum]|uniref:Gluconate kinase, FGGY family n=1 Tax=Marininema mesophilum TaxID=1048340 RepID=A0A1H2RWM3_9BACL|nr:gluconokinase [Marininema mesophilum]SDW23876.1 gluconate kinase, FGGY family [Marininema mesophilum]